MHELVILASLTAFFALVAAFILVLNRAARLVADTRFEDAFRRDGATLADRATVTIAAAADRIDRVRRRQDAAEALDDVIPGAILGLEGLRGEGGGLAPPPTLAALQGRLMEEIERAIRAVQTVEHGCRQLSEAAGRPRELEAETSIKRGYLNLLHAREALTSLATDLRSGRVDAGRWFTDRARSR